MVTRERVHVRCTACGSLRGPDAFGLNDEGEFEGPPVYATATKTRLRNERGRIEWEETPISIETARALLVCLEAAAKRLRVEIAEAERGG